MRKSNFKCAKITIRILSVVLACYFTISTCFYFGAEAAEPANVSYMIYECDTKQTLEKQNIDSVADCSLLSRLMTCLLILENTSVSVTDYLTPSQDSISSSGRYSLLASSQYMVDHLLKSVILCNADNAARLLAESVNPNKDYFVSLMNQKAIEIGMKNTYFTNTDGSFDELQRTTVYDMSLFWSYAMNNAQFRNIAANSAAHIWGGTAVLNECKLVADNTFKNASITSGCLSVYNASENLSTTLLYFVSTQTDNTPATKLTLVMSGFSADNSYELGKNYINNIFINYKKSPIVKKDDTVIATSIGKSELIIEAGETCYCMLPTDAGNYIENISYSISEKNATASVPGKSASLEDLTAPIEKGSVIGTVNYLLKDGSVHAVSIVAGNSVHSDYKTINLFYKAIQENTDIFVLISVLIFIEILLFIGFVINKLRKR